MRVDTADPATHRHQSQHLIDRCLHWQGGLKRGSKTRSSRSLASCRRSSTNHRPGNAARRCTGTRNSLWSLTSRASAIGRVAICPSPQETTGSLRG